MRALVTGGSGFAGTQLQHALREAGAQVFAPQTDVRDIGALITAFLEVRPDTVFHLAAQAFVPQAIADPNDTYVVNVRGTANVLAAMRALAKDNARARLVYVSSADVYGPQPPQAYPLSEDLVPRPANPYAASKLAAESLVLGEVRCYGLDALVTRAFNHIGPGQSDRFAVASFAAQLARIAAGESAPLQVGNLTARRDILDVRDVVRAYVLLGQRGERGEIYNVCSQTAISMREVLGELIRIARVPVEVREDPQRMRPSDTPLVYGTNRKLVEATGWSAQIPLRASLQDVYRDAQTVAAKAGT